MSRDRLICGYNAARMAVEFDDAITYIGRARGYVESRDYEKADGTVKYIREKIIPVLKTLIKTAPSVCPGVDETMLKEMDKEVEAAEKALSKTPYDLDEAESHIRMAKAGIYLPFEKR